jgi:myosin heavy subunit
MNPYHQLPIYRDADVENYRGRYIYERPPHMYVAMLFALRSAIIADI